MAKRKTPEINGGSMADIAFLLLIFFFVATTMDIDSGLSRVLPPYISDNPDTDVKERDVFVVLLNMNNALFVEGEVVTDLDVLKEKTKEFLANPLDLTTLPRKEPKEIPLLGTYMVSKGIISLQNDRSTSYGKYVEVQNVLIAAGNELRDELGVRKFGKVFDKCSEEEKNALRDAIPVMISEAEPRNIGGNK